MIIPKAVIFDLDDTLYDRKAAQIEFVKHLSRRFPHIFEGQEIGTIILAFLESNRLADKDYEAGSPWTRDKHSRYFLRLLGISRDYADSITETYIRDCHRINSPVIGAVPTVEKLSKKFKTAVITNGFSDVQNAKLEAIGLGSLFNCIAIGPEIGISKPDPEIFRYVARLLGITPSECLNVGDSYTLDVIGPKNAGMLVCWYNPEQAAPPEGNNIKADFVIRSLPEVLDILGAGYHPY